MKRINKKEILRRAVLGLLIALALCAALYAAYAAGVKSGLNAPGVEVIECTAEAPGEEEVLSLAAAVAEGGAAPIFEAAFMGGSLQAYAADSGVLCICDAEPGADTVYRYVLFGPYEISAEAYVQLHGGAGVYDEYDEARKVLVWGWGEEYETVTMYEYVVPAFVSDAASGSIAWLMTDAEFEIFRAEETIRLSVSSTEMPNLSAAFEM